MQFLYHNVLFFMFIPIIFLMFLIVTQKDSFQKYFSKEIVEKLSISNKNMNKTTRNILFFIALILMTIALARPVVNEKEQTIKQELNSIVVAIDVSKSMLASDVFPNRLTMAKQKLLNIIEHSKKNAIAIILFAKSSFILSPVSQDFNSLKILVENLDTGMNFDNGSNIFSSLETTNKLLKDYENKNLIILSDGGNSSTFTDEIKYANQNKINIYTIAIATKKASPIKLENGEYLTNKDGSIVTVTLNENIKNLSLNTNGAYINFSISNDDIKQILADIDKKSTKKELESKKYKTYTELFYYPLGLAIFILLIAFSSLPRIPRKKIITIISFLILFTNSSNINALEFDFQTIDKAKEYYKNKDYNKASENFEKVANTVEAKYNLANSLYKEKKYKQALNEYKNVISSNKDLEFSKLHNMGNSYVKLNDLENAKKSYINALKIKEDKETRENLEIIEKNLDKKNEKKDQKDQNQDKKNQDKKKQKQKQQEKNQKDQKDQNQKQQEKNQNKESQSTKKEEISKLEEKKWLNQIENKKMPVLLKKVQTKNEDNSSNPW